jgi:transcriptional regulator with XRE-family HTH domain
MLRQTRKNCSLTQAELAAIAPISQSQISKIEAGEVGLPNWRDIAALLDAMRVSGADYDQLKRQHEIAQLNPASYEFLVAAGI